MKIRKPSACLALFASTVLTAGTALADKPEEVSHAVNFFQNAKATGGEPVTVDAKSSLKITDDVELPGFAFQVYDVDITESSLTMQLVAKLEKLQITLYDDTTFDRYYYAFDKEIFAAELSDKTDENFKASVEILKPGTQVSSKRSFGEGVPTEFTFENGGILITIGEGTDLTKITENSGSLTVTW